MTPGARFVDLRDALAQPELLKGPASVVPRFAYAGRVTALASAPKAGKSTLMGQAVAALVKGEPFLGEPSGFGKVIWVALDEHVSDLVLRLHGFGAKDSVRIFRERPGDGELESNIQEFGASLVVIDTLAEYVSGIVDDINSPTAWQPVLKSLRDMARRRDCAMVLLDHTGKQSGNSLLGSTQKEAGVDVIITMTMHSNRSGARRFQVRGRVKSSDFSTIWSGGRNRIGGDDGPLDSRVLDEIAGRPNVSLRGLRTGVGGKAALVDAAIDRLIEAGLVQDVGVPTARSFVVIQQKNRIEEGHAAKPPVSSAEKPSGQTGTRVGHTLGHGTVSPSLKRDGETRFYTPPSAHIRAALALFELDRVA